MARFLPLTQLENGAHLIPVQALKRQTIVNRAQRYELLAELSELKDAVIDLAVLVAPAEDEAAPVFAKTAKRTAVDRGGASGSKRQRAH